MEVKMNKKIAIVTWHNNMNYGGTLQAYALQKTLETLGLDSEFINYSPRAKSGSIIRFLKDRVIFFYKPIMYRSRVKMHKFMKDNLIISPPYYTYSELMDVAKEKYSAAICGSDQIWSNSNGKIEPLFYLTFIDQEKRIAYAPSIGYNKIPNGIVTEFKKYVNEIRFLSVREQKGAELIKDICGRTAKVVLDPSFLLTKEQWEMEIKDKNKIAPDHKYILCYLLGNNSECLDYVRQVSKFTGYEIIAIESRGLKIKGVKRIVADFLDFVELINDATYILTDSFHGVAFSIILEKQFGVFKRFKDDDPISQNSRIDNILNKTDLKSRLINTQTQLDYFDKEIIDYNNVKALLEFERNESLNYLANALNEVLK